MVEIVLVVHLIFAVIFHLFVCVRHSNVDMIIIREQTEGEYTSLEHEVWLCFLFTAPGIMVLLNFVTDLFYNSLLWLSQ